LSYGFSRLAEIPLPPVDIPREEIIATDSEPAIIYLPVTSLPDTSNTSNMYNNGVATAEEIPIPWEDWLSFARLILQIFIVITFIAGTGVIILKIKRALRAPTEGE